jgi:putative acetyltransferase
MSNYPEVKAPEKAGSYPATAHAGGSYVWGAVLEYRVWCHPERVFLVRRINFFREVVI